MLLKVKAALLTIVWFLVTTTACVLIAYSIKYYGLNILFALMLAIIGAIAGILVYLVYSYFLEKLKHG